jgi:hypothetical protein
VVAHSVDSMTIAVGGRGLDGTAARTWAAGDYFVAGITNVALTESLANENLISLGALPSAADKLAYFTGAGVADLATLTAFARALLDDADAAAMRATLGVEPPFPTGTSMAFFNPSAPPGWTHDVTALDHALRLVAGAGAGADAGGASGGSVVFTAAFKSQAVTGSNSAVTLNTDQIPAHWHVYESTSYEGSVATSASWINSVGNRNQRTTSSVGGGLAHNHPFTGNPINLAVNYVNMIRATKD